MDIDEVVLNLYEPLAIKIGLQFAHAYRKLDDDDEWIQLARIAVWKNAQHPGKCSMPMAIHRDLTDHLRNRRGRRNHKHTCRLHDIAVDSVGQMEHMIDGRRMINAVSRIPDRKYQLLLWFRYVCELDIAAVAQRLNIPEGSWGWNHIRALRQVRYEMGITCENT